MEHAVKTEEKKRTYHRNPTGATVRDFAVKVILEFRVFFILLMILEWDVAFHVIKWLSKIYSNMERIWLKQIEGSEKNEPPNILIPHFVVANNQTGSH